MNEPEGFLKIGRVERNGDNWFPGHLLRAISSDYGTDEGEGEGLPRAVDLF